MAGEVVEVTAEGAAEHADELGLRYYGEEEFVSRYDDGDVTRVVLRIRPENVVTH